MEKKVFSRRDFLRLGSMMAAGLTIASCAPATQAPQAAQPTEAPKAAAAQPTTAPAAGNKNMAFWPEWGGKDADALKAQVDKFTAESGVAVDFLPIRDHARMVASISAGEPPDLLMTWDAGAVGSWGFQDALYDLTNYITGAKLDLNNFYKIGLDSGNLMGVKQIGLPLTNYLTSILWYNKDAFKAAGLDPEKPPETWEDTWIFNEKLSVFDNGQLKKLGFGVSQGQGGAGTMVHGFGGNIYSNDVRKVTPDSDADIQSLTWMRQFYAKYTTDELNRWTQSANTTDSTLPTYTLFSGLTAMMIDGEWLPSFYEPMNPAPNMGFGYMPYPASNAAVKGTMTANTNPMVIPKAAKNPDAAFKFIQFISRAENTAPMCAIVGNAAPTKDGLAAQIEATKSPTYKQILQQVWSKANVQSMTINSPIGSEYGDAYTKAVNAVLQDGDDPKATMTKLREEFQPKLDDALSKLGI